MIYIFLQKSLKITYFCPYLNLNSIKLGKLKEIFSGEHGGFFKFALVATAIVLLMLTFGPGNNVIHWVQAGIEISRQEKQIKEYREEIERMDTRIRMLNSDRDTLEKFAREQLHFAEPGDDVYILTP